jgi:hypothetical protein
MATLLQDHNDHDDCTVESAYLHNLELIYVLKFVQACHFLSTLQQHNPLTLTPANPYAHARSLDEVDTDLVRAHMGDKTSVKGRMDHRHSISNPLPTNPSLSLTLSLSFLTTPSLAG